MSKWITIFLLVVFVALSCNKIETPVHIASGEKVDVCLLLSVNNCTDITVGENSNIGETKAVNDPQQIQDVTQVIKNLWIVQYDGTCTNSKLLGEPIYIEDFNEFYSLGQYNSKVKLVATDNPTIIYFIANTFEGPDKFSIPQGSTVADLLQRTYSISNQESVLVTETNTSTSHPIFNGCISLNQGLAEGESLDISLKRNIAKLSITVKNSTSGSQAITIESVQICSVPSVCNYITEEVDNSATFPAIESFEEVDFEPVGWPQDQTSLSITAYLPQNIRGVAQDNIAHQSKNNFAPLKSTYFVISAYYIDENSNKVPISYTFYLGENFVDDFNLRPNRAYTYNIDIKERGDSQTDSRVTDWKMVDYSDSRYPLANSYILNPIPQGAGVSTKRIFRIPIQQIKQFWGTETRCDYEDNPTLSLRGNAPWRAFVIASDFDITAENFVITKSSGNSNSDKYFEVAVAPGIMGNVIVAVGPDDGNSTISWSWHLWITDYNPYEYTNWGDGTQGQYIYPVINGALHRYEGTWWSTNKDAYIMDRNLGALSDYEYPPDNRGLLYYQYGRKDPFFFIGQGSHKSVYKYPANKVHTYTSVANDVANGANGNGVLYSISNPLHYIKSASDAPWTIGNKYHPQPKNSSILWADPLTSTSNKREGEKSIFDPCPPGYRMPDKSVWSDFRSHNNERWSTNSFSSGYVPLTPGVIKPEDYKSGFSPYYEIKGLEYWPFQGADVIIPENVVYYPGSGFIQYEGSMRTHGNLSTYTPEQGNAINGSDEMWSFLWAENVNDEISGFGYTSQPNHLDNNNEALKTRALPVRCVTYRK